MYKFRNKFKETAKRRFFIYLFAVRWLKYAFGCFIDPPLPLMLIFIS